MDVFGWLWETDVRVAARKAEAALLEKSGLRGDKPQDSSVNGTREVRRKRRSLQKKKRNLSRVLHEIEQKTVDQAASKGAVMMAGGTREEEKRSCRSSGSAFKVKRFCVEKK